MLLLLATATKLLIVAAVPVAVEIVTGPPFKFNVVAKVLESENVKP